MRSRQEKHQARVEFAKDLARFIAERYGMTLPRVALKFAALADRAGYVQFRNGVWYVEIAEKYKSDDEQLASILAHELAHIHLDSHSIGLEPTLRNEELTDCTAALSGFGHVMLRANQRTRVEYYVIQRADRIAGF